MLHGVKSMAHMHDLVGSEKSTNSDKLGFLWDLSHVICVDTTQVSMSRRVPRRNYINLNSEGYWRNLHNFGSKTSDNFWGGHPPTILANTNVWVAIFHSSFHYLTANMLITVHTVQTHGPCGNFIIVISHPGEQFEYVACMYYECCKRWGINWMDTWSTGSSVMKVCGSYLVTFSNWLPIFGLIGVWVGEDKRINSMKVHV